MIFPGSPDGAGGCARTEGPPSVPVISAWSDVSGLHNAEAAFDDVRDGVAAASLDWRG